MEGFNFNTELLNFQIYDLRKKPGDIKKKKPKVIFGFSATKYVGINYWNLKKHDAAKIFQASVM